MSDAVSFDGFGTGAQQVGPSRPLSSPLVVEMRGGRSGAAEETRAPHKTLQGSGPEEDEAALVRVLCLEEH
jgi:hypothetical protein